jgi:O-antigen/teichoic acid export membrane protein
VSEPLPAVRAGVVREPDPHGRDRILRNVLSGWVGYVAMAVSGFVAPRLLDRKLGQEALGVWDFAWSIVAYFGLAHLGVGTSINRYVARYRAAGDVGALNRLAASVTAINLTAAGVILGTSALIALRVPVLLGGSSEAGAATWVILLLGATIASQVGFSLSIGVISGCHRYDLHNGITASFEIATSLAIVLALYVGGGLVTLAWITLGFELATELARLVCAHRVCPELRVRLRLATWMETRELLVFGAKSVVSSLSGLILGQGNRLLVGTFLGPATLAVYSRPNALVRVVDMLTTRFAFVLTPTASSLERAGELDALRRLLLKSARLGMALVLPQMLGLAILGDPLMLLWMGARYKPGLFLVVMMLGFIASTSMRPVNSILLGLNLHGALAKASLVGAVLGLLLTYLAVGVLHGGLTGAALALGLASTVFNGAFVAHHACRRLQIPRWRYLKETLGVPLACCLPFAAVLIACRSLLGHRPLLAVGAGTLLGALALAPPYWLFIVPRHIRNHLWRLLGALLTRLGIASSHPSPAG